MDCKSPFPSTDNKPPHGPPKNDAAYTMARFFWGAVALLAEGESFGVVSGSPRVGFHAIELSAIFIKWLMSHSFLQRQQQTLPQLY